MLVLRHENAVLPRRLDGPVRYESADRFWRTARAECTDRLLICKEQHLRHVLAEYAEHCNPSWPHRALDLCVPADEADVIAFPAQRIQRHDVLSGLIHEYGNAA
ncbi:transposase [Streptomyces sp. NBC_01635]|uniref:transposase n=1 Tax=Streptomyces sp. NBC_01635 TaxID=2975904 RepID=UPI0038656CD1|nr:transposase [Streptomyces sp. NBC_01635]